MLQFLYTFIYYINNIYFVEIWQMCAVAPLQAAQLPITHSAVQVQRDVTKAQFKLTNNMQILGYMKDFFAQSQETSISV